MVNLLSVQAQPRTLPQPGGQRNGTLSFSIFACTQGNLSFARRFIAFYVGNE